MRANELSSGELTIVVPISNMAGKLTNLSNWLVAASNSPRVRVILVHDIRDNLTSSELKSLTSECGNVKLIEKYFGNPGSARNEGFRHVTTEWVTFWDSDDIPIWQKYLEMISNVIDENIAMGEYSERNVKQKTAKHHSIDSTNQKKILNHILENPGVWRMIFRTSKLHVTSFADTKMGEDQYFLFQLNLGDEKISVFKENVYFYMTNQESQLTNSSSSSDELFRTIKLEKSQLTNKPDLRNNFNYSLLAGQIVTFLYHRKWKFSLHKFAAIIHLLTKYPVIVLKIPTIIKLRARKKN